MRDKELQTATANMVEELRADSYIGANFNVKVDKADYLYGWAVVCLMPVETNTSYLHIPDNVAKIALKYGFSLGVATSGGGVPGLRIEAIYNVVYNQ